MAQQPGNEEFKRALIVRKIAVTDLNENLLVDELNLFVAEAMLAHALVDVVLRRRERRGSVVVKRLCAT